MSRRHFNLAPSDLYLLLGSALLLALIGLMLSRDAEVAAPRTAMTAPALPVGSASDGVALVWVGSDSLERSLA